MVGLPLHVRNFCLTPSFGLLIESSLINFMWFLLSLSLIFVFVVVLFFLFFSRFRFMVGKILKATKEAPYLENRDALVTFSVLLLLSGTRQTLVCQLIFLTKPFQLGM